MDDPLAVRIVQSIGNLLDVGDRGGKGQTGAARVQLAQRPRGA